MSLYDQLFRHVAVRVPAERTHRIGLRALAAATPVLPELAPDPALAVTAMGLTFPSPLGVAAGYDKDAEGIRGLARLGFGAVEIGTVTARPHPTDREADHDETEEHGHDLGSQDQVPHDEGRTPQRDDEESHDGHGRPARGQQVGHELRLARRSWRSPGEDLEIVWRLRGFPKNTWMS